MTLAAPTLDVRRLPPQERHATIFATFEGLPPGGSLVVREDRLLAAGTPAAAAASKAATTACASSRGLRRNTRVSCIATLQA